MTIIKSMRGEQIDTDLFKIKNQLANEKKSDPTIKRESYVNDRRRRSSSRRVSEMIANEQMVKQKLIEQKQLQENENEQLEHSIDVTETPDVTEEIENVEVTPAVTASTRRVIKKQG